MLQRLYTKRNKKSIFAKLPVAVLLGIILALLPFLPFLEQGKNSEVKLYKKVFGTKQVHAEATMGMLTSSTGTSTAGTTGTCTL